RNDNALDCRLSVVLEAAQLPQRLAVAVYRITQEALTNVMRHANATQVDITVRADSQPGTLSLSIIDNGLGLTHQDVSNNLTAPNLQGIGLAGIRERVMANQGVLTLEAAQPQGLAIRVIFPLHAAAEDRLRTQARDLSHSAANPALS
ncbi:MAG: sensor histidine kinase, partial [Betaproteobacteria bacterium]